MTKATRERAIGLFWKKVDKRGPAECWEWTASRTSWDYGHFNSSVLGEYMAHRLAYELAIGPIPAGKLVMHTCDNPPCCNPEHLRIGTNQDNMIDKVRKGRDSTAILNEQQVREIKAALATPYRGLQARLCKKYGVKPGVICDINVGDTFQWVK